MSCDLYCQFVVLVLNTCFFVIHLSMLENSADCFCFAKLRHFLQYTDLNNFNYDVLSLQLALCCIWILLTVVLHVCVLLNVFVSLCSEWCWCDSCVLTFNS